MTDKQAPQGAKPVNDLPVGIKGSIKPGATGGKPDAGGPIGVKGGTKPEPETQAADAAKVNK